MKICFTGGGTLGHIYPAIPIKDNLNKRFDDFDCYWIGRDNSNERAIIESNKIKFYTVSSGKLRRYFSFNNIIDIFKILKAYKQSIKILKNNPVDLVFSKGGFVSVPIVYAAHRLKIPIVTHESDKTLGLATKLNAKVCKKVCLGLPIKGLDSNKYVYTGNPIRKQLLSWISLDEKERGNYLSNLISNDYKFAEFYKNYCESFDLNKPLLLIIGGSQGSKEINDLVYKNIDYLVNHYNVYHQIGNNFKQISLKNYIGVKLIGDELGFLYSECSLCISRAGAGALNEIINLSVNSLLIPLKTNASRGEQMANAKYFEAKGCVSVFSEKENSKNFIDSIYDLVDNKDAITKRKVMQQSMSEPHADQNICNVITSVIRE